MARICEWCKGPMPKPKPAAQVPARYCQEQCRRAKALELKRKRDAARREVPEMDTEANRRLLAIAWSSADAVGAAIHGRA